MTDLVMVPREPTPEMLDAARYFWGPWLNEEKTERAGRRSDDPADVERARQVWDEMIRAALSAPAPQGIGREALRDSVKFALRGYRPGGASINETADAILALLTTEPPAQGEG